MIKYEKPEMKILEIGITDIITTSGTNQLNVGGTADFSRVGSGFTWTGNK